MRRRTRRSGRRGHRVRQCEGAGHAEGAFTAALVSDIGKFNDSGFNQNQLEGPEHGEDEARRQRARPAVELGERLHPELDHGGPARARTSSIAAGFLLARPTATMREEVPERELRDHRLHGARGAVRRQEGQGPLFKNVEGLTYAANEVGLPRRRARGARWRKKMGGKTIGAVGGLKIPPVDIWIAGYKYCARRPCRA